MSGEAASDCDLLVLGDTGMAGAALVEAGRSRGLRARGASRRGEEPVDVADENALRALLERLQPRTVVNTVAIVSIPACERDPGLAWRVNARPAALIADWARSAGARVLHVSTDHFFSGDGRALHDEGAPVVLLNDYARTKYAAEGLALTHDNTLVLRTNILGLKSAGGGSLIEWALGAIERDEAITLFDDQFVSSIDVWALAEAMLDLAEAPASGLLNIASREVFSKADLIGGLAQALGRPLTRARIGSVAEQGVRRADSLGLDVSRAEALLGRPLPTLARVIDTLAARISNSEVPVHALEH